MVQDSPKKRERKLPEDALKHDDRHLMGCIFGEEVMAEVDKVVEKRSEESTITDPDPRLLKFYVSGPDNLLGQIEMENAIVFVIRRQQYVKEE